MYIAIDETYGPVNDTTDSRYVTKDRKSHVAVIFQDDEIDHIRTQMKNCIDEVESLLGIKISEFHFTDVYNRNKKTPWSEVDQENLGIFEAFAEIYSIYQWPVLIQTIDDRTLQDHGINFKGKVDGLDLSNREDLSLFLLLMKIKKRYENESKNINLILDEGREAPGSTFGDQIFYDWSEDYQGIYESSENEPLLQLADFLAFCINRSTHLAMKDDKTDLDKWFLDLVGRMGINSEEIKISELPTDFSLDDFDFQHKIDRSKKDLE